MSWVLKRPPHTVRPRSAHGSPVLLCLATFALTAIVVYRWGHESWIPANPKPTYTATAYVVERHAKSAGGDVFIPIVYDNADPRRAEEVADALADSYVHDRRAEWVRRTEGPRENARRAVETARLMQQQSERRLSEYQWEVAEVIAKPQASAQIQESSSPMTDNPEWLDMNRQLTDMERQRDNLLVERTALHPAVQDIAVQIADVKRHMAAIPRQLPSALKADVAEEGGKPSEPAVADPEQLRTLTAAVETSRRARGLAEAVERRLLAKQQAGPRYSIVYARSVEIPPTADNGWQRLVWTTLMAGALMAFGVGSISTGAGIDPPAASVGQVQADTGAPIVGTIPAEDLVANPSRLSRRQTRSRRVLLAIGLLLIAACPLAAMWGGGYPK